MNPQTRLNSLRGQALFKLRKLWPTESVYVDFHVKYVAGIKYLEPGEKLGCYEAGRNQVDCTYLEQMPTDSLIELLEKMEKKFGKRRRKA